MFLRSCVKRQINSGGTVFTQWDLKEALVVTPSYDLRLTFDLSYDDFTH